MSNEGGPVDLLEDRPDLADPLDAVLAVDRENGTWTFDDVPVDSGPFGELVSHGVVESVGDEYRVADPESARAALNGDGGTEDERRSPEISVPALAMPDLDRTTTAIVAAAVVLVGLVRAHPIRSVYRDGNVVLSGNDPYAYRYYVEQALASGTSPFDLSALATLPSGVQNGEPLMVATLWWFAELLGGSASAAGHVMAWYPVVSAVLTAALVYLLTVRVTDDRRVGFAAVLVLALIPGHALRTSLGFADHHAFDYVWLAATALALVAAVQSNAGHDLRAPRTWLASAALGVAIAGQTLAWEAAPLLLVPVALVAVGTSLGDVRADRAPLRHGAPLVAGVAVAAILTAFVHVGAGWHTAEVAFAPALLCLGIAAALTVAEAVSRTTGDVRHLALVDAVGVVVGLLALQIALPSFWATLVDRMGALSRSDAIAEAAGLFDPESFGFLFLFGFTLALALPAMAIGVRRATDDNRWLVVTVYGWYFFLLATIQVRFVGELAAFTALFAGYALVWIAAWIDAAAPVEARVERLRVPDRGQLGTLALLFLLVASLGIVQVPVKTSQVTVEDDTYRSSQFIADRSAELGQEYPENYVLSQWGKSRHYNYFVNGQSSGYGFARQNFEPFLRSPDPDDMYDRFEGRVGYVVVPTDLPASDDPTTYRQLTETYGSRTDQVSGVAHYRALYLSPGESKIVYAVVPGAVINGTAPANATVTLSTDISIPRAEFTYERQTTAHENGTYSVRVAHPGTYQVQVDGETREVTIDEEAVRNGSTVET